LCYDLNVRSKKPPQKKLLTEKVNREEIPRPPPPQVKGYLVKTEY